MEQDLTYFRSCLQDLVKYSWQAALIYAVPITAYWALVAK